MKVEYLVFKGILIGLSVSAPIGPIGVLCINRSISYGTSAGLYTGLGAAIPNVLYTLLALFGFLGFISPILEKYQWIIILSGFYIVYLGVKTLRHNREVKPKIQNSNNLKAFISTFIIMITNPSTIIGYSIIFTAFGLGDVQNMSTLSNMILAGSIGFGAMVWWIFLSTASKYLGDKYLMRRINSINKISGALIVVLGFLLIINSII
ncbi:MAG: LysE family transporter [Bacteroidetes bacterium]|nr:LysE family transporter [Bacteroidota bacterium]